MKLLTLLLVGLSAVALCHGTAAPDPDRIAPDEFCESGCVNGHCIADHGQFRCSCLSNWYGENCTQHICEVEDLCHNGGVCAPDPRNVSDYLCSCQMGFAGRNCQYLTHGPACDSNPCGGNGTCFNLAGGGWECVCHPGHYGVDCSVPNNDLCTKEGVDNCFGHGVCEIIYLHGELFPNCTCYPEWETAPFKCRLPSYYNVCNTESPCQNGGICDSFEGGSFYSCDCPSNFTGMNCTEHFDVCEPNPCQNGGTCSPTFGGHYYECSCPVNYDGKNCEYLVNPCGVGRCNAEETCVVNSAPLYNGLYNASSVQTECLTCESGVSHDHCSSTPCGNNGRCTSTTFSYVCECNVGWTGANCSARDHCAGSPCSSDNTVECINLPEMDSFVCRCADGWGGNLCNQDIDECLAIGSDPCNNGGRCVNNLGGYSCEDCPPNRTGTFCEVLLTCDDMPCLNGGNCSDEGGVVSCNCAGGYTGVMCEIETCLRAEHCANVSGNGICDYDCYTAGCRYDGGDSCTLNPTPNDPWANCSNVQTCRKSFKNGVCNVECNTAGCLYDGGDCQPSCPIKERCELGVSDGQCLPECDTQECPYDHLDCKRKTNFLPDELVLILISSVNMPFSGEFRETFLRQLGRLTNTVPSVIESRDITREEARQLSEANPINLHIVYSRNGSVIIYLVRLRLDVQLCTSGCPTSTEDVINQLEANFENGNVNIGAFELAGAYSQPPPSEGTGVSNTVIGVISALVVLVVLVAVAVAVLLGKRKIHAKIWRPHSPASSEGDSGSTSQGRRNSQAGGAVTGMEPTLQHSDSDSFMEKGAKKAKMMADSSVEYEAVDGRYEVAHDSRKWNPAHYEALRNPRRVHELLVGYKRQHSETFDVNAAGPGGFTPLMLVVMKRHSSHENIPGYPSRPSSISSEQAYAQFYSPYQTHDRTALVNGAAAGGRPISNGSILSRDGCYYPSPHGFIHPVDSSVTSLIKSNVDLNATNDFGQTALQLAAACSRADYVEQLLEAGANPNVTDNWGQSALQVAIGAGAEGSFMILINHPKTDLNQKSDGGITPLMAAVKVVNQYMLKMLIKKNADIAATDNDGRTALHWAAMVDNLDALKLLIRNGPETIKDAQDNKGQTALFLACREGSYGCVKHLIDCFANATLLDNLDQSPVHIAMQKQHLDIVALLQTQGPISYPPRVNLPYRPPGAHMDQEQLYQQYQATSRPLIKPFKSKSRQDHRNLVDHSAHMSYMNDLQRQQSHEMSYFGGMQPPTSQQTFGDIAHLPISTDPSSIPMSALAQSSYSSGAAAAVASVSSVTSPAVDGGSPPVCMGNSVVNTHPVVTNYLMSNSDQSHPLQQSTTPPSSSQYASPQSAGYGNPSPGYEGELTDYMGGTDIPSTSPGVAISQSLSPQSYNNRLPSSSSVVSPSQQLPSYSRYNAAAGYNQIEPHNVPVSAYATNSGSTRPLHHLSFAPPEVTMANQLPPSTSGGAPPTLAISEHHTSPPHMGSVSSGSPSSAYPSPGNELHSNYITHGYVYSSSRTSPPSHTPSPESREEQMVNAHGTFHIEHHPHDYPTYHGHAIPPDSGVTMV